VATRRSVLLAALASPIAFRVPASFARECAASATNVLGPAYRAGAPLRSMLREPSEPGTRLRMTGIVSSSKSCKAIRDAVVEVWQVGASGDYDMTSDRFHLRRRIHADRAGRYQFDSVVPAPYGVRAQHIHFLVSAPGHEPLITQCFFAGDERIKSDRLAKASLIVALSGSAQARSGVFDLVLQPERRASVPDPAFAGAYEVAPGVTLKIAIDGTELRWILSAPETPGEPLIGVLKPRDNGRYFSPEYDLTATFVKDDAGQVTHLLVNDSRIARKVVGS